MTSYRRDAQASRTITSFIMFVIGVGLTVGLYYVKTRAQSAKKEASRLERLVEVEHEALSVLKAELAHLSGPERVGRLARQELGLKSIGTDDVITLSDLDARFPMPQTPVGDAP